VRQRRPLVQVPASTDASKCTKNEKSKRKGGVNHTCLSSQKAYGLLRLSTLARNSPSAVAGSGAEPRCGCRFRPTSSANARAVFPGAGASSARDHREPLPWQSGRGDDSEEEPADCG